MRTASRFLASLSIVAIGALGFGSAHAANATGCTASGALHVKYTAAGSCKDPLHGWNLHCFTNGQVSDTVFHVNANAVGSDGGEVEACSDSGNGDTQGRLMLQGSVAGGG